MLDLGSGCLGSNPTVGNILSLDFFHVVKPLMPILSLLSMLSIYKKHENGPVKNTYCIKLTEYDL